jgi:thiamine-phosphate pyrophosphorylase
LALRLDPRALALVAITDDLRDGPAGLVSRAGAAVRGGATMVQLRLKHASGRELVEVARRLVATLPVPVIVNDRADVALAAGAAGVHLGVDDLPVAAVRAVVPPWFVVGASYGTDEELAHARGADYVGIGPVYGTASKDDAGDAIGVAGFERLRLLGGMPALAIGGITAANAAPLRTAGAAGVAVIRAVFGADDPEAAARALRAAFGT